MLRSDGMGILCVSGVSEGVSTHLDDHLVCEAAESTVVRVLLLS